jgi:hypothetical protein
MKMPLSLTHSLFRAISPSISRQKTPSHSLKSGSRFFLQRNPGVTPDFWQQKRLTRFPCKPLFYLVGRVGIEPTTDGLRVHCSTS